MLPEHIQALKKLWMEQEYKEKPIVDDQQLVENDLLLQGALHHDQTVIIKYYEDYEFKIDKGKVLFISVIDRCLQLDHVEIQLENIIEVNIL